MNFEERHIDVEGHRVRYLTTGEGPPLVLLHGVGTSSGEWSWVLPELARNNLVYAIDLPGYDGSYEPPDYSPAYTASFVSSFLDAVGVERAVVVGNSFGGLVSLHLALSNPARLCLGPIRQRGPGTSGKSGSGGAQLPRRGRAGQDLGQDAPRCRTEVAPACTATLLRASLANTLEVGQGPVQAGTAAELYGRDAWFPAQRPRRDGPTRGVVGPAASTTDADAYRVGDRGQVAYLLSGERGDGPRPRRLPRTHLQLRSPTPRRAARAVRIGPQRVPYSESSLASNLDNSPFRWASGHI
jgi:pimeloyl-ACP methyl ester carboxylesterase